jgi:hypothetical protein
MYDLTFDHFNKRNQPKEPFIFHFHTFSQNEHPFGQCGHFSQVEPFENHDFL